MNDLGLHIALFLLSAGVIVAVTCMYTEVTAGLRAGNWTAFTLAGKS